MSKFRKPNSPDPEKVLGKQLPANDQAEGAVLGNLLLNDEQANEVLELLGAHDFYSPAHKLIFGAMKTLLESHKRIDLISTEDQLEKMDKLEAVGGTAYLVSLQEDTGNPGLLLQHTQLVKDKSILRSLINSATDIIANCYAQDEESIDEVLDSAEKTIFSIAQKRTAQAFVPLNNIFKDTFQQLSDAKSHSKGVTGVPSGYKQLDLMTSGFQKGDFIVAAGRPSMGKTALALNMAVNAVKEGFSVGVISIEMAAQQLSHRLLSAESGVLLHKLRSNTLSSEEWIQLTEAATRINSSKIFIDETAMQTIMDVRTKARKLKAEHKIDILIIDYLQLLYGSRKHENRHQEVSEISRSLKALAKELDIPILSLAQLSRAVEQRPDKRPMLSDLRESGAIEQDADLIMFLYRDVVYNAETPDPQMTELIIGKQRSGPTGTVNLRFIGELSMFQDAPDTLY